jgi:hypothetical protein
MSDAMSFADLKNQSAELLPARTVLSMMSAGTVNNPPTGQIPDYAKGDQNLYGTWWYAWTGVLGLPHGDKTPPS